MNKEFLYDDNEQRKSVLKYHQDNKKRNAERLTERDMNDLFNHLCNAAETVGGDNFVAYGTIQRCNDRVHGYCQRKSLSEVLRFLRNNGDTNRFFVNNGELCWEATGHDNPINPHSMVIRRVKNGKDFYGVPEEKARYYTNQIGNELLQMFYS